MKISILNAFDVQGGASRAAYRLHHALRSAGIESLMCVDSAAAGDWTVDGPATTPQRWFSKIRGTVGHLITKVMKTKNPIIHSASILPSSWVKKINQSNADVVNLHWIFNEMMSVEDIGRIRKPIVWTAHDMWPFCGAEHYTEDARWRDGYTKQNRPDYESGLDLNRWVWNRKVKAWNQPMHIVVPSQWLANCVRQSALMRDWPVSIIHNAIDTDKWQPIERILARRLMHLPDNEPMLAFGSFGTGTDPRKGFDLLLDALKHLRGEIPDLHLVVFGQLPPRNPPKMGFPIHYTGHLSDDISLQVLYSAVDAMVVPSRQESFGQTASEAFSCGTPVVAFSATGLLDIVDHKTNGYLAKPFDSRDLASGIKWILQHPQPEKLTQAARAKAVEKFDSRIIARQYIRLYEKVIEQNFQGKRK